MEGRSGDVWFLTLQHSPIGMAMVDLDGRMLAANLALTEMLGYTGDELRFRGFQEITHPDDLAADQALFDRTVAGEIDSYRLRKRYLHAQGHVVWGDLSVALLRGPDREPLYFVSQLLDVTEQQHHEEELRAARADAERERQTLEAFFETVGVGLLLIGPDGSYDRMNRRHAETMRLPFPDGHGGEAGQLGLVYHLDGKTLMAKEEMPSYRAAQGEEFDDYAYWAGDEPDGRHAFSTSARQVRGPTGERLGAALAYQDVTDLLRAMKVKDEFVASVSHELRTPLTSVLGYLELLVGRPDLPEQALDHLRVVRRNAFRLQTLLSDLLQVGQAAELGDVLQLDHVDLAGLLRETAETARPGAEAAELTLVVTAPPQLVVLVDAPRIRQVIDNLLSNAVKYTPAGGTVTVALSAEADGIELTVTDTGIGVPSEEVGQVFERFFRGRQALAEQIPGTGLGLDIVSAIVAAHGGRVTLESEVGAGSAFRVRLPVRR